MSFAYGGLDQMLEHAETIVTDPFGESSEYRFDTVLRIKHFINTEGEQWTWGWSDTDLDSQTSPAGIMRGFSFSEDRTILTQTFASGNEITTTYAPYPAENRGAAFARPILQIDDNLGLHESRTYLATGYLEAITNGEGETTTYALAGNEDLTITDASGITTVFSNRGDHGKYLEKTRGGKTVNRTFDPVGNLLTVDGLLEEDSNLYGLTPGQGGVVSRTYDGDRNVASITLEDGGGVNESELYIDWRADHQQSMIERPYGGDTEYQYNALGRVVEARTRVNGVWQTTTLEYDLAGRNTAILKPNGMATRVTHRKTGEVASIRHELDWTDPLEFDQEVEFDYLDGRRIAIRDSAHNMVPEQYFYDAMGYVDEIRFPDGEKLTFMYDVRGRQERKQFWRPDASLLRTFDYEYDLANRQTRVEEDGTEILDTTFANGRVDFVRFGNGVDVAYGYDALTGALSGYTAVDSGMQLLASMTVNTTTCGIQLPVSRCIVEQTDSYVGVVSTSRGEYQTEDQFSERLIADSYGIETPVEGLYDYDELSNLRQSPAGDFIYNAEHNRLQEIESGGATVVDYVYDAAGYVIDRNGVPIVWNAMGLVVSAGAGLSAEWDSMGRRISITTPSETTHFKYGGELRESGNGSNQKLDLGWVVSNLDSSTHEYRLFDFRGNAKLTLDDTGAVTAHHHYSGYAQTSVDGSDPTKMGFAGGIHADDLVIIGARVYDSIAGRFLSQDPIAQTINQYSYTLGNPVRFWDPNGAQTVTVTQTATHRIETTITETEWTWGIGPGFPYFWFKSSSKEISTKITELPVPPSTLPEVLTPNPDLQIEGETSSTTNDGSDFTVSVRGEGSGSAFGPAFESAGSTGKGRDGPNDGDGDGDGGGGGTGAGGGGGGPGGGGGLGGGGGIGCGLGFEIVPVLIACFAIAGRRRTRR